MPKCISCRDPRDDELPVLSLHECWDRFGHVCPNLPIARNPEDTETDNNIEESVFVDYDFYNPTLHIKMDWVVVGDIQTPGCYLDSEMIRKIIRSN
jgi:hypothetical protein